MDDYDDKSGSSRDLLFDLRKGKGGWNPRGFTEPVVGTMGHGARTITYTFDSEKPAQGDGDVVNVTRLGPEQREAVTHVLGEIEKVANVKFRPLGHVDTRDTADLRFVRGRIRLPGFDKPGGGYTRNDATVRTVVLNDNAPPASFRFGGPGYGTVAHEILHALGLSHPAGAGDNPRYSKDATAMSYNPGRLPAEGIAPLDVAALQYLYGTPRGEASKEIITSDNLRNSTIFYSKMPLTLKLGDRFGKGSVLMIDLSSSYSGQAWGSLEDITTRELAPVGVRLAPGTQIRDVLTDPDSPVTLFLTGNALPNTLQGGASGDTFSPRGGNDVMTGNGGSDRIVLGPRSGTDNRVTDFDPAQDKLHLTGAGRAEFRRAVKGDGVEVLLKGDDGAVLASVLLQNADLIISEHDIKITTDKGSGNSPVEPTTPSMPRPGARPAGRDRRGAPLPMSARRPTCGR